MPHASTAWRRAGSSGAQLSRTAPPTRFGGRGMGRSRSFGACAPSTCSIETFVALRYFPPAMNVIPQNVRDGFGKLIDPLAVVFIRLHVRPNLITTGGTLVVIASATAVGLGWVHSGGLLLLVSGVFDRVGESALFSGIAVYFLRGGVPPERLTLAVVACLVALAASLIVSYTRARDEGLGLTAKV